MARPRSPSSRDPLPEPLPPEKRTVGQLVAEALKLYGDRFWLALPLGLPLALAANLAHERSRIGAIVVLAALAPALTLAYAAASALAAARRPATRDWLQALVVGTAVFLPAALVLPWFNLLAFAWLALTGLVVPVSIVERLGPMAALRRAVRLARADYVHALGSFATLAIAYFLTRLVLVFLLRGQGDQAERIAVFLADIVLSPVLFLGAALLYFDQAARVVGSGSRKRLRRRKRDADLHHAHDAHRPGRPDAEVES